LTNVNNSSRQQQLQMQGNMHTQEMQRSLLEQQHKSQQSQSTPPTAISPKRLNNLSSSAPSRKKSLALRRNNRDSTGRAPLLASINTNIIRQVSHQGSGGGAALSSPQPNSVLAATKIGISHQQRELVNHKKPSSDLQQNHAAVAAAAMTVSLSNRAQPSLVPPMAAHTTVPVIPPQQPSQQQVVVARGTQPPVQIPPVFTSAITASNVVNNARMRANRHIQNAHHHAHVPSHTMPLTVVSTTGISPQMVANMNTWKLDQIEAHVSLLRSSNQPIPQAISVLYAEARRREEKRTAKRVANRKSACTSRARKKAFVEEMTRTNARLRRQAMILALLPDLVVVISPEGEITFASDQVERVLRHDISDMVGAKFHSLLVPASREALNRLIKELLAAEEAEAAAVAAEEDIGHGGCNAVEITPNSQDSNENIKSSLQQVPQQQQYTRERIRSFDVNQPRRSLQPNPVNQIVNGVDTNLSHIVSDQSFNASRNSSRPLKTHEHCPAQAADDVQHSTFVPMSVVKVKSKPTSSSSKKDNNGDNDSAGGSSNSSSREPSSSLTNSTSSFGSASSPTCSDEDNNSSNCVAAVKKNKKLCSKDCRTSDDGKASKQASLSSLSLPPNQVQSASGQQKQVVSQELQPQGQNTNDDYSSSSSISKAAKQASDALRRNVQSHNAMMQKALSEKSHKGGPVVYLHTDDVTGAMVTANNAEARLSSLQHKPSPNMELKGAIEKDHDSELSEGDNNNDVVGRANKEQTDNSNKKNKRGCQRRIGNSNRNNRNNAFGNSSDDSGYREGSESFPSKEDDSSTTSTVESSSNNEKYERSRPLAPTCNICLIRDDLTTIWCEVTSSIRTRSRNDDSLEDSEVASSNNNSGAFTSSTFEDKSKVSSSDAAISRSSMRADGIESYENNNYNLASPNSSQESNDNNNNKGDMKELLLCLRPIRDGQEKVSEELRFNPSKSAAATALEITNASGGGTDPVSASIGDKGVGNGNTIVTNIKNEAEKNDIRNGTVAVSLSSSDAPSSEGILADTASSHTSSVKNSTTSSSNSSSLPQYHQRPMKKRAHSNSMEVFCDSSNNEARNKRKHMTSSMDAVKSAKKSSLNDAGVTKTTHATDTEKSVVESLILMSHR